MARWNHTVIFSSFYHNNEITLQDKASLIVSILKKFKEKNETKMDCDGLEVVIDNFESLSETIKSDDKREKNIDSYTNEFNGIMSDLYDFADEERIWIKTT